MCTQRLRLHSVCLFFFALFLTLPPLLHAQTSESVIQMVHPLNNSEIISKKLTIEGRFLTPIYPESVMILLDGIDLTGIADVNSEGFSCDLIDILPSGEHSNGIYWWVVSGCNAEGDVVALSKAFSFTLFDDS